MTWLYGVGVALVLAGWALWARRRKWRLERDEHDARTLASLEAAEAAKAEKARAELLEHADALHRVADASAERRADIQKAVDAQKARVETMDHAELIAAANRLRERRRGGRGGAGLVLFAALATGSPVRAEEPIRNMPHPETGEPGAWVSSADLRGYVLADVDLSAAIRKNGELTDEIDALRLELQARDLADESFDDQLAALERALEASGAALVACKTHRTAWYRRPVFTVPMGALAGLAVAFGAVALAGGL